MQYTRESAFARLLHYYEPYYNIERMGKSSPIAARLEYYEHSGQYIISKRAEVWAADSEEFLYLVSIPHLTANDFESIKQTILEDGMKRLHIGPGHMASYISAVFLCDSYDEDAKKALKKSRIFKSFHFSLHGWMDFHTALVDVTHEQITSNFSGHRVAKILKKVLYNKHKKGRLL